MTFALTGLPSSFRVPITAAEIVMGQGASNAPLGARDTIYVGPMLSSGAAAAASTVYEIGSEAEAIELFGAGSPLHRALRMHIRANKNGRVYACAYAPSSGDGLDVATEDITITGTATGTGRIILEAAGDLIEIGYKKGDGASDLGDILEAKINALTHLPFEATNTAGVVAADAKVAGASQNGIHRIRVVSVTPGTGITVDVGGSASATLSGGVDGATTERSNYQAALAALAASTHYYIAITTNVSDFVDDLKAHVAAKNEPNPGILCKGMVALVGSLANTATIAIAQNSELVDIVWQRNSRHSPDEVLANWVAIRQKHENTLDNNATESVFNFDNYAGADWFIKPAPDQADWPDLDDQNDAINDGITPIASTQTGSYIVMSVSTRSKDSTGSLDDFRAAETHRLSALHCLVGTIKTNHRLTFTNFKQQDDPRLPDGSVDLNAIGRLPPRTTVPFTFRSWFLNQLEPFFLGGKLQRRDEWEEATEVRIDPQNSGRMQVRTAGRTIDLHHQATFRISETTPN